MQGKKIEVETYQNTIAVALWILFGTLIAFQILF